MKSRAGLILLGIPVLMAVASLSAASNLAPARCGDSVVSTPSSLDYVVLASIADGSNALSFPKVSR